MNMGCQENQTASLLIAYGSQKRFGYHKGNALCRLLPVSEQADFKEWMDCWQRKEDSS